jgi:hypothetical protein
MKVADNDKRLANEQSETEGELSGAVSYSNTDSIRSKHSQNKDYTGNLKIDLNLLLSPFI